MAKRHDPPGGVLIYGMNYAPELTGVGRYTGELGAWLARSRRVEVVTTPPHYPGWYVRPPHRAGRYVREMLDGATVWRCPIWLSRKASGVRRLVAPLSFALASAPVALWRMLRGRPEVVLCVEPTLAVAPVALIGARMIRARTVLHVQDLEVDAAFAVGHLRPAAWLRRIAFRLERFLLRRFGQVITISHQMAAALVAKGVDERRITIIRNWVDTDKIKPLGRPSAYRAQLGFAEDDFVVLYSGQIGAKQSLHILFDAAEALANEPCIRFVVAGEGPLKEQYARRYGHLPNLTMLPLQPEERLCEFLNLADCHLLPQDPAVADLVLPSKLGGMLASGKRIIATADPKSEIGEFLAGVGELVEPQGLAAMVVSLSTLPAEREPAAALASAREIGAAVSLGRFASLLSVQDTPGFEDERKSRAPV